jgi:hypothetical protein
MATIDEIFYDCCKNNKVDEALKMMENGAKDYKGGFIGFCKAGNLDMVKYMIIISGGRVDYDYGLRTSSFMGQRNIVLYLLSVGAGDVNGALYHACKGGNADICKILMEKYGAKIYNKKLVIEIAKQQGHNNIVDILIN